MRLSSLLQIAVLTPFLLSIQRSKASPAPTPRSQLRGNGRRHYEDGQRTGVKSMLQPGSYVSPA
jgi:hypothetical protein